MLHSSILVFALCDNDENAKRDREKNACVGVFCYQSQNVRQSVWNIVDDIDDDVRGFHCALPQSEEEAIESPLKLFSVSCDNTKTTSKSEMEGLYRYIWDTLWIVKNNRHTLCTVFFFNKQLCPDLYIPTKLLVFYVLEHMSPSILE